MYQVIAETILIIHALFILFLILGLVLILLGNIKKWPWIRNFWFRSLHLSAIGFVVVIAWLDKICPLTLLENRLRQAAGGSPYTESFVQYWVRKFIYYDFSPWIFTLAYTLFGGLVLLIWFWIPPDTKSLAEDGKLKQI